IDELKNKLDKINQVRFSTHLKSEFDKATKDAQRLETQIKRLEQGISGRGLGSKLKGWRKDFTSSLPGAELMSNPLSMAGAGMSGIWTATQKAMQADKEKMRLQVLTGSQEIGQTLYDSLTKYATDTVFGTELYDMATTMLSNGIKDSDVMPMMKMLGDISMGDANKLGSLSLAFSQVQGKGHLAGQELLQFVNAGFNPLQVLSEKTGESMESLTKRMSDGTISVSEVRKAMELATGKGGRFYDMINKVAQTPSGQLEQLKGQLEQMMVKIGTVFLPIASKMMGFFSWIGEKIEPILEPLVVILGSLSAGLLIAAAAQWVLNLAIWANPITWIVTVIVALIGVITWLVTSVTGWGNAWRAVVNNSKLIWGHFTAQVNTLWESLTQNFMIGLNKIKQGWYEFKGILDIGNKGENEAALQKIAQDTENRKKIIAKAKADEKSALEKMQKGYINIADQIKIKDSDNPIKTGLGDLGKVFGVGNILGETSNIGKAGKAGASDKIKQKAESISAGGSKQTNIVINIDKVGTDTKIYVSSVEQGLSNLGDRVREELLRAVNSMNQLQTG
ncbi:MAG: tape measure protein, partial [Bergeyella zoohelcum]|nr:tape measure protein [Bergeyella zoohelcum]